MITEIKGCDRPLEAIMKRYFVNGKEITKEEAKAIEQKNNEYFNSGNMMDMLKIQFIVEI